ncbi:hypothetical protein MUN81_10390 [Hymenobacter sp. 5317J-9]|uniref:hypothetical protein n=1 Tax=Hymenobacter sp. 5317J-9 TaxID=2932250 RepID=UPI001FD6510D|nr:hypothetical protein [Hymenobacter sp. 5317J-9]UOQ99887.1 hypothetical protein MUN81_10390 [Hymenobacter sp. 5317J-9]
MSAPNPYDLRNVEQVPADNLGGIEALWYTLAANLLHFPATGALAITGNLAMKPGTCWYQLVSVRHTTRYKQTRKDLGRHGDAFTQQLVGTLARHTPELAAGLEALDGQELVALYRDHNGQMQLVGTPEQPLLFSDMYDSGLATGTRNNYDWTLAGQTPRRSRPYLGTWAVSGQGLGGSIVLGSGAGGSITIRDVAGNVMATVDAGRTVVVRSAFQVAFSIL